MTATVSPTIRSVEAFESAIRRLAEFLRTDERRTLTMAETHPIRPELVKYLNRLFDSLYALARLTEHQHDLVRIEQLVRAPVRRAPRRWGNLMLLHRRSDSLPGSSDIVIDEALTSSAFSPSTKDLSTPTGERHGIQNSNRGRMVVFGGGLPVFIAGRIAGGMGVSGGTADEDVRIVMHAISTAKEAGQP